MDVKGDSDGDDHDHDHQDRPKVMVLKPPTCFALLESISSHRFNYLKAWDRSDLTPSQFLAAHGGSVRALLSSANGPAITADVLRRLPSLGVVVTTSVGLDHVDVAECRRRGLRIANARGLFSDDVADLAVALLLDVLRRVSAADRYVRRGVWPTSGDYSLGSKLRGKRAGIVGLGNIGTQVAKRLEAFGCIISYNSREPKPSASYPFYRDVAELASNSDALVVCCALTDQTRHMVGKRVLAELGREGVIVNVGRGAIIDERELVRCLVSGEIKGAGLDVFENEPSVPPELFSLDNVVLSPHSAVFTHESYMNLCQLVLANLDAFFSNKPLVTPFE